MAVKRTSLPLSTFLLRILLAAVGLFVGYVIFVKIFSEGDKETTAVSKPKPQVSFLKSWPSRFPVFS